MSSLLQVSAGSPGTAVADVVFVHGIQGDLRTTWTNKNGGFWPSWLAEDIAELAVWSLGYDAAVSGWAGTAMPLFDRANQVLAELKAAGIGGRPMGWVTHSMGGLLVKKMLRNADSLAAEFRSFASATRFVVFIGTPHTGSDVASLARYLRFILRPSVATEELEALNNSLLELNTWYRENCHRLGVTTHAYFENQDTKGVRVVDRGSADPGLPGVTAIGLDADHLGICKPAGRDDLVYKRTKALILETVAPQTVSTVSTDGHTQAPGLEAEAAPGHPNPTPSSGGAAPLAEFESIRQLIRDFGRGIGETSAAEVVRVAGTGWPLAEERLSITADGDHLTSTRMTPGQPGVREEFPRPAADLLSSYNAALAETACLSGPPGAEVRQRLVDRVRPLSEALARVVPMPVRERITASAGKLVAVGLTLATADLEKYPWELIGEPGLLGPDERDVVVWRSVMSSPPSMPRQWRNGVLLASSAPMQAVPAVAGGELSLIASALAPHGTITVHCEPNLAVSALSGLLDKHRAAVFHFAAYGAGAASQPQTASRPTLQELGIDPQAVGAELSRSNVRMAVLDCGDSASLPASGGRTAAYQIAAQADAAVIGMAGRIQPYAAALFAAVFYSRLAIGTPVVKAYYEGTRAVRSHHTYATMGSIPVMYARTSNVIPFPTAEARAHLSFQQTENHVGRLGRELASLAGMSRCDPAEWAVRIADPAIRIEGITEYLPALTAARPPAGTDPARYRRGVERARDELAASLRASRQTLFRLSDDAVPQNQRDAAQAQLRLRRLELERILMNLRVLFEDTL